jgi:hypothetical protein
MKSVLYVMTRALTFESFWQEQGGAGSYVQELLLELAAARGFV